MKIFGAAIDETLRAAASAYLRSRVDALFFQSVEYVRFLADLLGARDDTLVATDGNGVRGVLPLMSMEGGHGRVFNSLPFFGSNGGILADDESSVTGLLNRYNEIASDPGTAASTLITSPLAPSPVGMVHNFTDFRIGQLSPIAYAHDHAALLMQSYHQKTRNMVRKAERGGVLVKVENDAALSFLKEVHGENLRALGGAPKPDRFFELLRNHFSAGTDYRIYTAWIGEERVAALLLFYFSSSVEYFTPVVRERHRETQALSLIIHTAMIDASQAGYRWWNWGGTWATQDGVHRFKKRWGTEDRRYDYYVQVNNRSLRRVPRAELLADYPFFYVLPFSALEAG